MSLDTARSWSAWEYRHAVLGVCVGAYFAIRFAQLLISPVIPALLDTFAVSRGRVGLALTGMWVVYALVQLPSGVFADRFGGRLVVVVSLAAAALAGLLLALTPSFLLFGAFVILLGVGAGLYYNAATAILTTEYDNIGSAIGVHRVGSQVAGLLAPVVAAVLGAQFGWRVALGAGGVVALAVLALFVWQVESTTAERPDAALADLFAPRVLLELLCRPTVAYTTFLAMLGEFAILATMSFLPTFLVEHHGLSLATAGLLFSGYFAVVGLLQPIVGVLSDRLGRDTVLGGMFAAGVLGYGLLGTTTSLALAVPGVVLVGVAMSWGPPIQSRAVDRLTPEEQGTGFGLVRTGYILVGALGTTVVGTVADVAGWGPSFLLLGGLLGVAACSLVVTRAARVEM